MGARKPDEIAASLLSRIVERELERVPSEDELVAEYRAAKGTVREARRVLEDRGVLRVEQGRPGATIRPQAEWSLFELPVLDAVLAGPDRRRLVAEAIECRRLLEPQAAAFAAERARDADLVALDAALERMRAAAERPASRAADERRAAELAFRRGVLDAARNQFLTRAVLSLAHATEPARPRAADAERRLAEHADVRDAIAARDAERARAAAQARLGSLGVSGRRGR